MHHRSPPKLTLEDIPRSLDAPVGAFKSSAPAVVVACWCDLVAHMDREHLDRFTRSIWRRFDAGDLEPLKDAILRRRDELTARDGGAAGEDE